jgi:DNA polymerase (family 10)
MKLKKAQEILLKVKELLPYRKITAGSIRRKEPEVNDIDIIIVVPKLENKLAQIRFNFIIFGKRRIKFNFMGMSIDLFICLTNELPFMKLQYFNTKEDNIKYRAICKCKGYKLNQYGLFKDGKKVDNGLSKVMEMISTV